MSTELYTQCYVTINGKLLLEHASVSISRSSGAQPVTTVGRGFAGMSIGAPSLEIDVTNAVPVAGYEFNAQDEIESLEVVEIGLLAAGLALTSKGFIISDSFKHAVNSESTYDFKFHGNYAKFG